MSRRRRYTNKTVINIGDHFSTDSAEAARWFLIKLLLDVRAELIRLTPVDKGYLRLSITMAINNRQTYRPPSLDRNVGHLGYADRWAESDAAYAQAVNDFKLGDKLQVGYTADYAPYVEAKRHMVKTVLNRMPQLMRAAARWARRQ